jgi:nucleoside-diphosphate-sugar epimerase
MVVGITGASGFVGSALMRRHIDAGDVVRCLSRQSKATSQQSGVQVIEGDLERPDEALARFSDGLDVLYHCAAEVRDVRRMQAVNVEGVRALLRAAAGRIGRWVQLSSVGVYGASQSGLISEDTAVAPRGIYEQTKADADALVTEAGRLRDIASYAVLRPSIVFGPGMPNQSIAQMMRMVQRRLFFYIGRSGASANYVHVSNVADALLLCGTSPQAGGRVYNLSDWCTVEDFVDAIADALGCPRPRLRLPEWPVRRAVRLINHIAPLPLTDSRVDALINRNRYSIQRIQRDLTFSLAVSIPTGLAQMVAMRTPA